MPRPRKCRKVCSLPKVDKFSPCNRGKKCAEAVVMTVDEYETIRLIDYQNFSQEECGEYMKIARTTVQQIYNNARKKVAKFIVEGKPLKIEGGDYELCGGEEVFCACGGCEKHASCCRKMEVEK